MAERRTYTAEYRRDAVLAVLNHPGTSISEVARLLNINPSTLARWVRIERHRGAKATNPQSEVLELTDRIERLSRENARLLAEHERMAHAARQFLENTCSIKGGHVN